MTPNHIVMDRDGSDWQLVQVRTRRSGQSPGVQTDLAVLRLHLMIHDDQLAVRIDPKIIHPAADHETHRLMQQANTTAAAVVRTARVTDTEAQVKRWPLGDQTI
jgi:hypothetical protein